MILVPPCISQTNIMVGGGVRLENLLYFQFFYNPLIC